jgi:hypothetical protein
MQKDEKRHAGGMEGLQKLVAAALIAQFPDLQLL